MDHTCAFTCAFIPSVDAPSPHHFQGLGGGPGGRFPPLCGPGPGPRLPGAPPCPCPGEPCLPGGPCVGPLLPRLPSPLLSMYLDKSLSAGCFGWYRSSVRSVACALAGSPFISRDTVRSINVCALCGWINKLFSKTFTASEANFCCNNSNEDTHMYVNR